MARKPLLRGLAPDGTIVTRRSYREYQYVLLLRDSNPAWRALSWHSTHLLASKKMDHEISWRLRRDPETEFKIVPVISEDCYQEAVTLAVYNDLDAFIGLSIDALDGVPIADSQRMAEVIAIVYPDGSIHLPH